MARLATILRALARAQRRDQRSAASVAGNNFFIVTALLLQDAGTFIYLIIGFVLLFPLSTDPLRKIPPSRLALWPLAPRQRRLLRLLSPWVNPITWAIAALAVWSARGKVSLGMWALAAAIAAAGFALSEFPVARGGVWRRVPHFPGPLDQLVRKNLREILSTLDFYCALLLSLTTVAWRLWGPPLPVEAFLAITVLVVLALSSYSQSLFGLDGAGGLSRYRLLPLKGWRILAAKDAAFFLVTLPLLLPLAILPGISAALVVLSFGHFASVHQPREQLRWRFSTGTGVVFGLIDAAAMAMAGVSTATVGPIVLLPCVLVWLISLWWCGRSLFR
jgi:hypothetical protein